MSPLAYRWVADLGVPRPFPRFGAISQDLGLPFLKISAPEIVSGMSGESEQRVRDLFNEAKVRRCACVRHGTCGKR